MKEEARVFLRTALYALGVALVYWFVSYEVAGTVMLAVLGIAAASLTMMLPTGRSRPAQMARGLVTLGDDDDPALEIEETPLPVLSLQPLFVAMGAVTVALGLVFGAWLWLPGILIVLGSGWRWLTEIS
jgi:hypothetical protein